MDIEFKSSLPFGEANRLDNLARGERDKYLVLFSDVRNKVVEINPKIISPFRFVVGEPSPLGLFAYSTLTSSDTLPPDGHLLTCWPMHQRSTLAARVIFADNLGKLYRDIDLKGIGWIKSYWQSDLTAGIREIGSPGTGFDEGFSGLIDLNSSLFDKQMSEEFANAGVRTHRVLAIMELLELITDGRKITIAELYDQYILPGDYCPVVAVRAYGTKARIKDITLRSGKSEEYRRLLIEDAKKIINQEKNINLTSDEEYLRWFAETLGTNIRLMHKKLRRAHNCLTEHNITLDCRITDHGSVSLLVDQKKQDDLAMSEITLRNFTKYLGRSFKSVFEEMDGYNSSFSDASEFWISEELIKIFRLSYGC